MLCPQSTCHMPLATKPTYCQSTSRTTTIEMATMSTWHWTDQQQQKLEEKIIDVSHYTSHRGPFIGIQMLLVCSRWLPGHLIFCIFAQPGSVKYSVPPCNELYCLIWTRGPLCLHVCLDTQHLMAGGKQAWKLGWRCACYRKDRINIWDIW